MADWSLAQWVLQLIAFPFQLLQIVMNSLLNIVVFDVLDSGPFLPLASPF